MKRQDGQSDPRKENSRKEKKRKEKKRKEKKRNGPEDRVALFQLIQALFK